MKKNIETKDTLVKHIKYYGNMFSTYYLSESLEAFYPDTFFATERRHGKGNYIEFYMEFDNHDGKGEKRYNEFIRRLKMYNKITKQFKKFELRDYTGNTPEYYYTIFMLPIGKFFRQDKLGVNDVYDLEDTLKYMMGYFIGATRQ